MQKHCFYCGVLLVKGKPTGSNAPDADNWASRDHRVPKSNGGFGLPYNTVSCCIRCNRAKGILSLEEYRLVVAFRMGLVERAYCTFAGEVNGRK